MLLRIEVNVSGMEGIKRSKGYRLNRVVPRALPSREAALPSAEALG